MLSDSRHSMDESTGNHKMGQPDRTRQPSATVLCQLYSRHTLVTLMDRACSFLCHLVLSELTTPKNFMTLQQSVSFSS